MNTNDLINLSNQIKRDIIRMVNEANSGHPGGSLGCADLLTLLYFKLLKLNDNFNMNGLNEDLFFLSNGHISPLFYSVLARRGFFPIDELKSFRKINSRLQGHPTTAENLPGIRIASGSLGQGLSVAIGAALSKKYNNDPQTVYVLLGDGEIQEGQIWEAALFAAHKNMDNLIAIIDNNGQQIDGTTEQVLSLGNIQQKFESFNWQVKTMDGHNFLEMEKTINFLKSTKNNKPKLIVMQTIMGKGVDFMENKHQWHGIAPNAEQTKLALDQLPSTEKDF